MGGHKFRLGRIRKSSEKKRLLLGQKKPGRPKKTSKKVCDVITFK